MKYPENRITFTVSETAKACGVSRSTLIRMEESGFLKPYRIDPDSGYRFYDADNIAAIGQYQFLQGLGLSRNEISDFYYQRIDTQQFLEEQKEKLYRLSRLISQLEMRLNHGMNFSTSYVDLPQAVYFCTKVQGQTVEEMGTACYEIYGRCIRDGIRIDASEPLMMTMEHDWSRPLDPAEMQNAEFCFPVLEPAGSRPDFKCFPAVRGFSMLCFGDYSMVPAFGERFYREIREHGVIPAGPTRLIALVGAYTGSHFKPGDYCGQWIVPVEKDSSQQESTTI